jgi:hypothetical protein
MLYATCIDILFPEIPDHMFFVFHPDFLQTAASMQERRRCPGKNAKTKTVTSIPDSELFYLEVWHRSPLFTTL